MVRSPPTATTADCLQYFGRVLRLRHKIEMHLQGIVGIVRSQIPTDPRGRYTRQMIDRLRGLEDRLVAACAGRVCESVLDTSERFGGAVESNILERFFNTPPMGDIAEIVLAQEIAKRLIERISPGQRPRIRATPSLSEKQFPNGPHPPKQFVWNGKSVNVQPKPWHLLNYLWQQPRHSARIADAIKEVWGPNPDDIEKASAADSEALKSAIKKLNTALHEAGSPHQISQTNGYLTLG